MPHIGTPQVASWYLKGVNCDSMSVYLELTFSTISSTGMISPRLCIVMVSAGRLSMTSGGFPAVSADTSFEKAVSHPWDSCTTRISVFSALKASMNFWKTSTRFGTTS